MLNQMAIDVAQWLRGLGLAQYEESFRKNAIDARVVPELTVDDLKELGVAAVGHRRLLLNAMAALRTDDGAAVKGAAQLERASGFARDDPPEERLDKLATMLGES